MRGALPYAGASHQKSPATACIWPLLSALDWAGEPRHLYEALPEGEDVQDFEGLRVLLTKLDYGLIELRDRPELVGNDELPMLLCAADGDVWVILEREASGNFQLFKGREGRLANLGPQAMKGRMFLVRKAENDGAIQENGRFGWLGVVLERENATVRLLFALTFLINCLALALPLYLLTVFDLAIGARSTVTLTTLCVGLLILIAAEIALREIRTKAIVRLAVKTQTMVMTAIFERILRLPISYIEGASVAGQLNRLRMFEGIRDIFSGPAAASLLDLPFIVVFVTAVFLLGGWLGWLLVGFIVSILGLAAVFVPNIRVQTRRAAIRRSELRMFRADFTHHIQTIRDCAAEPVWMNRYRSLIAYQLRDAACVQKMDFTEQTFAQFLSIATGALIVGFGATRVMDGSLTVGSLTAIMAIVWRVLSPMQTVLLNIGRVFQALDTASQINRLMAMPQETKTAYSRSYRHIKGTIALENVSYRANGRVLPILRGIDLIIPAGQLLALTGAPGPSRSTVLKLIANLTPVSSGRIRIDGCDIRQFDTRELRRTIALVSEEQIVFSGSLAHNFSLANPMAEDHEIREAMIEADLLTFVERLDDGLRTDLTGLLNAGLSASICQKIRLARAYLLAPSIYLFDEPTKDLNPSGQSAFLNKLHALKGKATVIVRTSDARIVGMADKAVFFHAGRILESVPANSKPSDTGERLGGATMPPTARTLTS